MNATKLRGDPVLLTLALGLLALAYFLFSDPKPQLPTPPSPAAATVPTIVPRTQAPARHEASHRAGGYPFGDIRKHLEREREEILGCFAKGTPPPSRRLHLDLRWDRNSHFADLASEPKLASETEACLKNLISAWQLPRHPGLRPFEYAVNLEL